MVALHRWPLPQALQQHARSRNGSCVALLRSIPYDSRCDRFYAPSGRVCRQLPRVVADSPASTSAPSRSFQMASSSAEGAVPIRPAGEIGACGTVSVLR